MGGSSATGRRRIGRFVAIGVAAAIVLGGAPAAFAAVSARQPAAVTKPAASRATPATRTPMAAATTRRLATTTVHGWSATRTSVQVGKRLRVHVRVNGGVREVRLERRVGGVWKVVDHGRTTAAGRVTLHWRAPKTPKRAVLRLHVLRGATAKARLTSTRTVAVVRPAPRPSTAPRTVPSPSSGAEAVRARLFALVNAARASARTCGGTRYPAVPPLRRSSALDTAAGDYATRMAAEGFFSHTGPDGSTMGSRLQAVGIANTPERENIAAGQGDADAVMADWLGSDGHCANIMAADVTRIGLGHADRPGSPFGQYWVQDFAG